MPMVAIEREALDAPSKQDLVFPRPREGRGPGPPRKNA
jgi:hypothetical protein